MQDEFKTEVGNAEVSEYADVNTDKAEAKSLTDNEAANKDCGSENGILSEISAKKDAQAAEKKRRKKLAKQIAISILSVLLFIFVLNILILPLTGSYARVGSVDTYDGSNQYITLGDESGPMLSAHRAGGDLAGETAVPV